jgi:hypothetical protein
MRTRTVILVLLAVLVFAPGTALAVLQIGDQAPNFTLPDTAWVNHQLAEFRGQVVLLNFWQAF